MDQLIMPILQILFVPAYTNTTVWVLTAVAAPAIFLVLIAMVLI